MQTSGMRGTMLALVAMATMLTYVSTEFVGNIKVVDLQLRKQLLATISTLTVPVVDSNKPINIMLGLEMKKIIDVNVAEQEFKVKVWIRMSWTNEFLKWQPEKWGNITWIKVKPQEVWVPDIAPYNDLDEEKGDIAQRYQKLVHIKSNGYNSWYMPVVFTLDCHIQIKYFPFDVQHCPITLGSWEYDVRSIRLEPDANFVLTADFKNSSLWDILHVENEVKSISYPCCKHPYSVMSFSFIIHRRSLYFVYNVIIPCTALTMIILMSFFLPPNSGERITVVITILLALCLFLQFINTSLPKNCDAIPVLSVYYIAILIECTLSLVTTCIVLICHHRGNEQWAQPVPAWVKKLLFKSHAGEMEHKFGDDHTVQERNGAAFVNGIKAWVKKLLFKNHSGEMEQKFGDDHTVQERNDAAFVNGIKVGNGDSESLLPHHQRYTTTLDPHQHDYLLRQMFGEMKRLTSQVASEAVVKDVAAEWRHLSMMLDRCFFYLFVFLFTMTSVVILVPAYFQHEDVLHH